MKLSSSLLLILMLILWIPVWRILDKGIDSTFTSAISTFAPYINGIIIVILFLLILKGDGIINWKPKKHSKKENY